MPRQRRQFNKTINLKPGDRLKAETPLGIVNITTGLRDADGRDVDSIAFVCSSNDGRLVTLDGFANTRLIAGEVRPSHICVPLDFAREVLTSLFYDAAKEYDRCAAEADETAEDAETPADGEHGVAYWRKRSEKEREFANKLFELVEEIRRAARP